MTPQTLTILGATGTIGVSTLAVVALHPERFRIFALSGANQIDKLAEQCRQFQPRYAVVLTADRARQLQALLTGTATEVLYGIEALEQISAAPEVDSVMAAIVGAAGLRPALAAARAGKRILLANKETLVMAGAFFMDAVREGGATLLPIDSEHNAIFQSMPDAWPPKGGHCSPSGGSAHSRARGSLTPDAWPPKGGHCSPSGGSAHPRARGSLTPDAYDGDLKAHGVRRILLTASGGPFRNRAVETLSAVTPEEAVAHPNWVMGKKISVDSATMMNKGLEVIEARWLFNASPDEIEVVIHPQSIIHSMVEYQDGSVIAQLSNPDMRTPIAHALAYPDRIPCGVPWLELAKIGTLTFENPDPARFPCLSLAFDALRAGGAATAILNAANEIAVAAFLGHQLPYLGISATLRATLEQMGARPANSLDELFAADQEARRVAAEIIATRIINTPA